MSDDSVDNVDRTEARPRRKRPDPTPAQRALGLLVRREHSRKELTRKLVARGVDTDAAVAAVDKLHSAGWQDDTRFAETLIRSRAANGYGPLHISAELASHGLGREAIAAALNGFEGDWNENARDLIRRRYGPAIADDLTLRRKAIDLLIRRGFDTTHIRAATSATATDT